VTQRKRNGFVSSGTFEEAINRQWDAKRKPIPTHSPRGQVGRTVSMHTSFLSLLYDVVRQSQIGHQNAISPPKDMVPLARHHHLYEAWKTGHAGRILTSMRLVSADG
jgi:hypothetical protein